MASERLSHGGIPPGTGRKRAVPADGRPIPISPAGPADDEPHAVSSVVYVGSDRNLSDCMARALVQEMPDVSLLRARNFEELQPAWIDDDVRLVLVDAGLNGRIAGEIEPLRQLFPDAVICALYQDTPAQLALVRELAGGQVLRCFLPMRLRLDTWLAAIRLMVLGGEHIPPELCVPVAAAPAAEPGEERVAPGRSGSAAGRARATPDALTVREVEVLELVARGFQNKNVAAMLNLSEHTVKLHMHHIISKLGARNRTEAAAIFFDGFGSSKRAARKPR